MSVLLERKDVALNENPTPPLLFPTMLGSKAKLSPFKVIFAIFAELIAGLMVLKITFGGFALSASLALKSILNGYL